MGVSQPAPQGQDINPIFCRNGSRYLHILNSTLCKWDFVSSTWNRNFQNKFFSGTSVCVFLGSFLRTVFPSHDDWRGIELAPQYEIVRLWLYRYAIRNTTWDVRWNTKIHQYTVCENTREEFSGIRLYTIEVTHYQWQSEMMPPRHSAVPPSVQSDDTASCNIQRRIYHYYCISAASIRRMIRA